MAQENVIVLAATPVLVDFTFASIDPDTPSMREAITQSLQSFFVQGTAIAEDVLKLSYDSVLISTIDSGGNRLNNFSLSTPTGDITVNVSELPVLGTITFP